MSFNSFCATFLLRALKISAAMEKRNALPKSKAPPPPESSEEESGSSEEETEDEEQVNEGSGLDSGSAESADASKKKRFAVLNPKQQVWSFDISSYFFSCN